MKDLLSFQQKLKQILWRLLQLSHSFPSFKCKQIFAAFSFEREVNWHQTFLMTTSCHWSQMLFNFVWACMRKVMHFCEAYQPVCSLLPGGVGSCLQRSWLCLGEPDKANAWGVLLPDGSVWDCPLPGHPIPCPLISSVKFVEAACFSFLFCLASTVYWCKIFNSVVLGMQKMSIALHQFYFTALCQNLLL